MGYKAQGRLEKLQNYIDGNWQDPASGEYIENMDPSRGTVYSLIPDSGKTDVDRAAQAARNAFPKWSASSVQERSAVLMRIAKGIEQRLEELAHAESRDNGKPIQLARAVDIPRSSENFAFYASAILHEKSEAHLMGPDGFNYTLQQAMGVAGCISPWNLPLYLFSWKIAPALAAGCSVVAKPSEVTPYTAWKLSEICMEAGLPPGVLNIVHGTGSSVGQAIVEHPDIPVLSFTGGTQTGAQIMKTAGPRFKKVSLELGGKNPNIIFADCDFEDMLRTTVRSSFANQGQICLCGSRIFIERPIYEKFREAFVEKVAKMKVGDPFSENTRMGALVSRAHLEKVKGYIELAEEEGGKLLTGGTEPEMSGELKGGYYLRPTVIEGLPYDCRTNQEEIFGPVVTLQPFDTEEEVLGLANSTSYGLAATLWTSDLKRAHRMAAAIESGIIWVNCWLLRDLRTPFGGMKNSGMGREGGFEALRFFTEPKNVCIKL